MEANHAAGIFGRACEATSFQEGSSKRTPINNTLYLKEKLMNKNHENNKENNEYEDESEKTNKG